MLFWGEGGGGLGKGEEEWAEKIARVEWKHLEM